MSRIESDIVFCENQIHQFFLNQTKGVCHGSERMGPVSRISQIAVTVLLLKRIIRFIVKVMLDMRKLLKDNPSSKLYLPGPEVPKFIVNLIQWE